MFPLAIGPEPETLRQIGPGVLWVGALLATMLGLSRMFESDFRDGSLEHMLLSPHSLGLMVLGKITAHWLLCGGALGNIGTNIGIAVRFEPAGLVHVVLVVVVGHAGIVLCRCHRCGVDPGRCVGWLRD